MSSETAERPYIEQLMKSKLWKHIPSGRVVRALPDIGSHILFKFWKQENLVDLYESSICDHPENFVVYQP